MGQVLSQTPTRPAYHPGAHERRAMFLAAHPEADGHWQLPDEAHLPWTFIPDVAPAVKDDICFPNESFCGLIAETVLEAEDEVAFLEKAVQFANQTLWGNLTATMIVHPDLLKDTRMSDHAFDNLRYGMILINQFAGLGFFAITTTWGAYPGNERRDIQSGQGVTSNTLMFHRHQKLIVRSPFKLAPDPFALTLKNVDTFARDLAALEYDPSSWKAARLTADALRS